MSHSTFGPFNTKQISSCEEIRSFEHVSIRFRHQHVLNFRHRFRDYFGEFNGVLEEFNGVLLRDVLFILEGQQVNIFIQ